MLRHLLSLTLATVGLCAVASAGHHHRYSVYGAAVYGVPAPAAVYYGGVAAPVVYAAPVAYAAPVVSYQPAFVVPTATVIVGSYPVSAVSYAYAPMVPSVAAYPVAAYYAPVRRHHHHIAPISYRHYRPRDVEIEIDYRRDGGYRYEIDFD